MRYTFDHDLHIHSNISLCSKDPLQTTERILQYAKDNGLKTICLTDHFWDEDVPGASGWYQKQNFAHVSAALPLPQADGIKFLFGCETETDKFLNIGISDEMFEKFDFVVIPTTHFHMTDFTVPAEIKTPQQKAACWVERLDAVLEKDLPFHKIGIAHLTCGLIAEPRDAYLQTLNAISEDELKRVFTKAAQKGVGIELNSHDMDFADDEAETVLRPYKIAKEVGCKFYLGSDTHRVKDFAGVKEAFEKAIDLLDLTQDDKFILK